MRSSLQPIAGALLSVASTQASHGTLTSLQPSLPMLSALCPLLPLRATMATSSSPTPPNPGSTPAGTQRASPSRLNTWKGPAGQPPPRPPPEVLGTAALGAAGAGGAAAASSDVTGPLTWIGSHQVALASIPAVPKLLGFAGAVPFITLTPYVVEAAGLSGELVTQCAKAQVGYGALIVTFLGAVHWGLAMTSTMSGPRAAAILRERYVWSIFPSLAAWPALLMHQAPASAIVALLLGICYLSDRSYFRMGSLPTWYMALRGYLTTLAFISMTSTAAYYLAHDVRVAQQRMAEDDALEKQRKEKLAAEAAAAAAAAAQQAAPTKKGWFK